jgi:hypothetical protein
MMLINMATMYENLCGNCVDEVETFHKRGFDFFGSLQNDLIIFKIARL